MEKMMSPNTTITFIPLAGLTTPDAPKATELNAGTNLSCAIVTGYTLNATASDTDDSKTICDEGNVQTRTLGNYEANISFFRDPVGAAPTVFSTAYDLFKTSRVEGWLVSRQGKKSTEPFAVGDIVSVYKVMNDSSMDETSDKGTPIRFTVPFLQRGEFFVNVDVAA